MNYIEIEKGYLNKLKTENRVGRIDVSIPLLENTSHYILKKIFSDFIIIRAECLYNRNVIEYIGYCMHFDSIEECEITPSYRAKVHENEDTGITIKWERIND